MSGERGDLSSGLVHTVSDRSHSLTEFSLIARYVTRATRERRGVGDDCALIDLAPRTGSAAPGGTCLAITADMLVEGVHFLPGADPADLGHKALAVNLSDLAAAGARPRCFLLSLALPAADPDWLEGFSSGLFALADAHQCELVGGDTTRAAPERPPTGPGVPLTTATGSRGPQTFATETRGPRTITHEPRGPQTIAIDSRGPLTIAITALGEVDAAQARGRDGARPGDRIWVSGSLGDAALALAHRVGTVRLSGRDFDACRLRMDRPQPRIDLGLALRGLASAAIDVSDGLLGDLGHLLERSGVGAVLRWAELPRSAALAGQDLAVQQRCLLAGGDDYELLFTAPPAADAPLQALSRSGAVPLTRIGEILADRGLALLDRDSRPIETTLAGFDHFR